MNMKKLVQRSGVELCGVMTTMKLSDPLESMRRTDEFMKVLRTIRENASGDIANPLQRRYVGDRDVEGTFFSVSGPFYGLFSPRQIIVREVGRGAGVIARYLDAEGQKKRDALRALSRRFEDDIKRRSEFEFEVRILNSKWKSAFLNLEF